MKSARQSPSRKETQWGNSALFIHAETLAGIAQGGADPLPGLTLPQHHQGPGRTSLAVGWLVMHKENDEPSIPFLVSTFKSNDRLRLLVVGGLRKMQCPRHWTTDLELLLAYIVFLHKSGEKIPPLGWPSSTRGQRACIWRCLCPKGFSGGTRGKEPACQCRRCEKWVWSLGQEDSLEKEYSTLVFLLGESHVQRSLVGYSPWGHKESDATEVTWHAYYLKKECLFLWVGTAPCQAPGSQCPLAFSAGSC